MSLSTPAPTATFTADKAWPGAPEQIAAPSRGLAQVVVAEGHLVNAGDPVATICATERTTVITAPLDGVVQRIAVPRGFCVECGDLLLMLERSHEDAPRAAGSRSTDSDNPKEAEDERETR